MLANRCEWFDGLDYNKVIFRKNLCDMIGIYRGTKVHYIESIYYYDGHFRVDYCNYRHDIVNFHLFDGIAVHIKSSWLSGG